MVNDKCLHFNHMIMKKRRFWRGYSGILIYILTVHYTNSSKIYNAVVNSCPKFWLKKIPCFGD